jgi:hypothetical protein
VLEDYYQDEQDSDVDSLCNTFTETSSRAITSTSASFRPSSVGNISGRSLGKHHRSCIGGGLARLACRNQDATTTAGIKKSTSAGNIEWKAVERKPPPKFLPKPVVNLFAKKQRLTLFKNSNTHTHTGSGSGRSLGSLHRSCSGGGLARLVCRNQNATTTAGIKHSNNGHGNEFEDAIYNSNAGPPHTGSVLYPDSMIQHHHSTRFCSFGVSANEAERLVQMGELEAFDDISDYQAGIADEDNNDQDSASMEELRREDSHRSQETVSQGERSPASRHPLVKKMILMLHKKETQEVTAGVPLRPHQASLHPSTAF